MRRRFYPHALFITRTRTRYPAFAIVFRCTQQSPPHNSIPIPTTHSFPPPKIVPVKTSLPYIPPQALLPNPSPKSPTPSRTPSVTAKITFQAPPSILTSVPSYYFLLSHHIPKYSSKLKKAQRKQPVSQKIYLFSISLRRPAFPESFHTQSNIDTRRCRRCLTSPPPKYLPSSPQNLCQSRNSEVDVLCCRGDVCLPLLWTKECQLL